MRCARGRTVRSSSLNCGLRACSTGGAAATTARARRLAVRRFAAWLTEEGEIPADPFLGVTSPKLDERVIEPLTDDELRALIKACAPPQGTEPKEAMRHRRDGAIVRVMLETGLRAGEVVALQVDMPTWPRARSPSVAARATRAAWCRWTMPAGFW